MEDDIETVNKVLLDTVQKCKDQKDKDFCLAGMAAFGRLQNMLRYPDGIDPLAGTPDGLAEAS